MGAINNVDARPLFTKTLIDVYSDMVAPTGFLRSFFKTTETSSKEVSIEVQRGTEKIAVDVLRGTEGNRNDFAKFTEKVIVPPYFREYIDHTSIRHYDIMFGRSGQTIDEDTFSEVVTDVAEALRDLTGIIERAQEVQCSQVLQTGIVTLASDTNIDFKRKGASMVDLTATNYWADSGVNPTTSIQSGCEFLRKTGKAVGGEFMMILGSEALTDLLGNTLFKETADLRRVSIVDINTPQRQAEAVGSVFHGQMSAGSWKVNIWTYPQFFDTEVASGLDYVNTKNMILLPMQPKFKFAFASVPKIMRDQSNAEFPQFIQQSKGAFSIGNYIDNRADAHIFDVKSAGVPIPTAVDQIYTAQVVAT